MKTIYISLNDLDSSLPRLWEACENENALMHLNPLANEIAIFKTDAEGKAEIFAKINVVNVVDSYDIVHELF